MVIAIRVDGQRPNQLFPVEDVHQSIHGDDPDPGSCPPLADRDLFGQVPDAAHPGDLPDDGVRGIDRLSPFVDPGAGPLGHGRGVPVPLRRGEVVEGLVGPLPVVVVAEPVQKLLEVGEVEGRTLVCEPGLEVLWNRSSFPRVWGW